MRTFNRPRVKAAVLAVLLALGASLSGGVSLPGSAMAQSEIQFSSPWEAYDQGISAYKSGYYEFAVPALVYAANNNVFPARFYLAKIYADARSARTDHAKAYGLFRKIIQEFADVDPDLDRRAPFVAKSLTALAGYVGRGLPAIGLNADLQRAAKYIKYAATYFNDEDAQFELAKLYLHGEGVTKDVKLGTHWLSVLTQKGHAGAQAFLADLYWRGKYVRKDQTKALALITVAVANAPDHERIWIEDIYQNIYCGTTTGTRKSANGFVAVWKKLYGRVVPRRDEKRMALGAPTPERTCSNGEAVAPVERHGAERNNPPVIAKRPVRPPQTLKGDIGGFGLRDAGAKGR